MGYDIPPQLEHQEKIAAGMTLEQWSYIVPTIIILVILLNLGVSSTVFIVCSIPLAIVSVFFVKYDGRKRILDFINHYRNTEVETENDELKKIVDIQKLDNNDVITSKGKVALLEVIPLNFLIKTKEEQEQIINGFQKFLNSLDFPVQIHISSHPITLDSHFKALEEKTTKYPEFFTSYQNFITSSIKENGVKNRKFYVVIREKKDLEVQVQVCEAKLRSIGLKVTRVPHKELVNLFHEYIAQGQDKKVKEGQIVENYTHFLFTPNKIMFHPDSFEVDGTFCKVLAVNGYPHSVEMGFLDKIISSGENYDISIHIEPFPINDIMVDLNKDLRKQQADLLAESERGILNPSLEIKFKSTRQVLEDLQKGKEKLFNVSLYVLCKGKSKEEAELLSRKVKADLEGLMIQSESPLFQMRKSYESVLPLGLDPLQIKRNIPTKGLSSFFPFSSPFLDVEDEGILLGLNKNGVPYIKDIFQLTNQNGLVLATSGGGKSYFTKLMISRQFLSGSDIIIIDPQGEYLAITDHYKGETITISKNSKTIINPLDLMGHEYLEKRLSLMDLFKIMFGELTEPQKAMLDKAVDATYKKKGITSKKWDKKPPRLSDLYQTLKNHERVADKLEKVTYRALMNRLGMYTKEGVFGFLDRDTNIDFSSNFVCFNIGAMPKQVKPVVMYLVLDFVYQRMKKSLRRKILVIDEAWAMLQTAEESSYVFEIVKTCRKYNMGLLMITQDVADLVGSRAGSAVLANTSYTFLLRQKPAIINNVARTFNLSQMEKDYLITAEKGEGVLILENEHQELSVIASKKEHELVTTNPDELIKKNEQKEGVEDNREEVDITLNTEQDVYLAKDLSHEERTFLDNNGYMVTNCHGLKKGRQLEYFVKYRHPESLEHTYYVDLIYQEIKKYTNKVKKYRTEQPDIIFTNGRNERVAIEVETGKKATFRSGKKDNDIKFAKRKEQFGENCHIFLPKARLENSYKRHELPIIFRLDIEKFVMSNFRTSQK